MYHIPRRPLTKQESHSWFPRQLHMSGHHVHWEMLFINPQKWSTFGHSEVSIHSATLLRISMMAPKRGTLSLPTEDKPIYDFRLFLSNKPPGSISSEARNGVPGNVWVGGMCLCCAAGSEFLEIPSGPIIMGALPLLNGSHKMLSFSKPHIQTLFRPQICTV